MRRLAIVACCIASVTAAASAEWSNTEAHLQFGTLDTPSFAGGGDKRTTILTLQHASGWKYGENFFFVDFISAEGGGFNDSATYGEWYTVLGLRKLARKPPMKGPIKDVRFVLGTNRDADADVVKYLPGVGLSWNVPGFSFLNLDVMAYLDDSVGLADGGAPRQDDSFLIDVSWALPLGNKLSLEGHMEYAGSRDDELGQRVDAWFQAQPQLRYRLTERLAVGVEYQYWRNKLGDGETDESAVQGLVVWGF